MCPDERQKQFFCNFFSWISEKSSSLMANLIQINFFRTGNDAKSQCFDYITFLGLFMDRKWCHVRQNGAGHPKIANTHFFRQKIAKFAIFIVLFIHHPIRIVLICAAMCVLDSLKKDFGQNHGVKVPQFKMSAKNKFSRGFFS